MPLFYQHNINADEKLGVWKIEEDEAFFLSKVSLNREISHQHKRLQHLAGRYLLQYLFPDFPYELIKIADTRKPFLNNEAYHFSISHCSDYAAALVSRTRRVGVDIEIVTAAIKKIQHKFLSDGEAQILIEQHSCMKLTSPGIGDEVELNESISNQELLASRSALAVMNQTEPEIHESYVNHDQLQLLTLCWSAKEAMYKWYGSGLVDFKKHMVLQAFSGPEQQGWFSTAFLFQKEKPVPLVLKSRFFSDVVLTYVVS